MRGLSLHQPVAKGAHPRGAENGDRPLDRLPAELSNHLFTVAGHIGNALQNVFQPTRVGLMIAGLEVPHMHVHVVPMDGMHDLDFSNAATSVDREDLEDAATAIRRELEAMGLSGASG